MGKQIVSGQREKPGGIYYKTRFLLLGCGWFVPGPGFHLNTAILFCFQVTIHSPVMASVFDSLEDQWQSFCFFPALVCRASVMLYVSLVK